MQTSITIKGSKRDGRGKGPARRLRAEGKLPAVLYGPGMEGQPLSIDPKDVRTVLTAPLGRNTVFSLELDGKQQYAMLKSFEYHPLTREPEHADLYSVALDRPVRVEVPFSTTGKAKGVAAGGTLRQVFRKLPVKCTPDKIPAKIEIDVTNLELGAGYQVKDLPLPEGVKVMLEASHTVVNVVAPEAEEKAAAAAATAAPAAAPAKGAAAAKDAKAAPAKDAKAAAPAKKK